MCTPGICAARYYRMIARMQLAKATSERKDTGDTRRHVLLAREDATEVSGRRRKHLAAGRASALGQPPGCAER